MQQVKDQRSGGCGHVGRTKEALVHVEQRADRQVADSAKGDRRRHHVKGDQTGTPHPVPLVVMGAAGP
jgi:hypothetical protein